MLLDNSDDVFGLAVISSANCCLCLATATPGLGLVACHSSNCCLIMRFCSRLKFAKFSGGLLSPSTFDKSALLMLLKSETSSGVLIGVRVGVKSSLK